MAAPDETPDGPIRVVYADDSFLMREALEAVLERLDGVEVVAGCVDGDVAAGRGRGAAAGCRRDRHAHAAVR